MRISGYIVALILASSMPAIAQDWTVTTADFRSHPAVLTGISAAGVRVQFPGNPQGNIVNLDDFVSIQRAPVEAPHGKFTLSLLGGDRVTGEPVKVADEQLQWHTDTLGNLSIPLSRLHSLTRGDDRSTPSASSQQDVISLANGDTVTGVFLNCSADKVSIRNDAGTTDVPLATVSRIAFAATTSSASSVARSFRIRLSDGSSITTSDCSAGNDQIELSLDEKPPRKVKVPFDQVVMIEQLNGPISWLSSRQPVESEQVPYFSGSANWPARMDRSVDGSPIRFGSQLFDHGIGVHSYSRLTYNIEEGWKRFRTQYAIDSSDEAHRPLADVTVRIKLDGKTVREQQHVHAGLLSPVVLLDLNGAKTLTLEADYGEGGDTQDHLNWIEPSLLRALPQK